MSVMESYNFSSHKIKKRENYASILYSKSFQWSILMVLFTETIDPISAVLIWIENGKTRPNYIIQKYTTVRNYYKILNKSAKLCSFVIFTAILWKRMLSFMAHMIPMTLEKVNSFLILLVSSFGDFHFEIAAFWKSKRGKGLREQS